jgi:hypothetical protein
MAAGPTGETPRMTNYTYYALAASDVQDVRFQVGEGADRSVPVHMIFANPKGSVCIRSERLAPAPVEV